MPCAKIRSIATLRLPQNTFQAPSWNISEMIVSGGTCPDLANSEMLYKAVQFGFARESRRIQSHQSLSVACSKFQYLTTMLSYFTPGCLTTGTYRLLHTVLTTSVQGTSRQLTADNPHGLAEHIRCALNFRSTEATTQGTQHR